MLLADSINSFYTLESSVALRCTKYWIAFAGRRDPEVGCGSAVPQRIIGTPEIIGSSFSRVYIDGEVWHLDVGSSHPGAAMGRDRLFTHLSVK